MKLVQRVESKFSVQYFLVSVLVVNNCLVSVVCSEPLEETCPRKCTCGKDTVLCSDLGLTEIPTTILAEHVRSFDFSHNNLLYLKDFAFRDYLFLDYLDLSHNEIEKVYPKAFQGLKFLNNIDLSYNNLLHIESNIFSDCPILETVSFRGNQLAYFPDSPPILASLSITTLDLSYCTLTSVNADTFSQLPNLRTLIINSNRLREINWDYLKPLTELSYVDLGDNMWKCDCKILEVLKLLSDRRKATSMDGEHKPVKCYKDGEYKEISTEEVQNSCTGQAEKEGSTFLEPKPEERTSKETSTIFVSKAIDEKFDKLPDWSVGLCLGIIFGYLTSLVCILWWTWKYSFSMKMKLRELLTILNLPNVTE